MKKLFTILLLLICFNGFSQVVSSNKNLLKSKYTYPKTDLIQSLTTSNDTQLVDAVGSRYGTCFRGRSYEFNGIDNYIDCGVKVQGQNAVAFNGSFIINSFTTRNDIFSSQSVFASKGITLWVNTDGTLRLYIGDGSAVSLTALGININTKYTYSIYWNGIKNTVVTFILNGIDESFTSTIEWIGDSDINLRYGKFYTYYLNGRILNYSYTINGNPEVVYNCEEGAGTTSYSTTGETATLNGTLTNFFIEDDRKITSELNDAGYGYNTANPDILIPINTATNTTVIPCDVVYRGEVKRNATRENIISSTEFDIKQLICPKLVHSIGSDLYYTFTDSANVVAKTLDYSDIPTNQSNVIFWNKPSSTEFNRGLWYRKPQSSYNQKIIDNYFNNRSFLIKK